MPYSHGEFWTQGHDNSPSFHGLDTSSSTGHSWVGTHQALEAHSNTAPDSPDTVCWVTSQFPQENDKDTLLIAARWDFQSRTANLLTVYCLVLIIWEVGISVPVASAQRIRRTKRGHIQPSTIMWIMSVSLLGGEVFSTIQRNERNPAAKSAIWCHTRQLKRRGTFIYTPLPPLTTVFSGPQKKKPASLKTKKLCMRGEHNTVAPETTLYTANFFLMSK